MPDPELDRLADALRSWAVGPDWRKTATCGPLQARGEHLDPDGWYPVPPVVRSRAGNPSIAVHNNREWCCVVVVSPTGKNPTVLVPKGTKVVEVDG